MATAYIALGSNLGDRAGTLLAAVRELNATPGVRVTRLSTFHDTAPVGGPAATLILPALSAFTARNARFRAP